MILRVLAEWKRLPPPEIAFFRATAPTMELRNWNAGANLDQRSAAARAGTGSAAEAMVAGENFTILDDRRIEVPKIQRPISILPVHLQHLIEVAVEDFARPTHADSVPTH